VDEFDIAHKLSQILFNGFSNYICREKFSDVFLMYFDRGIYSNFRPFHTAGCDHFCALYNDGYRHYTMMINDNVDQ
jgi:hypothetical protein